MAEDHFRLIIGPMTTSANRLCTAIFTLLAWIVYSQQAVARIIWDVNGEAIYHAISSHLADLNHIPLVQVNEFIFFLAISTTGQFFSYVITVPILGVSLWKHRADKRMWTLAVIGGATACIASYAIHPLVGFQRETTIEAADRQLAVWLAYSTVLAVGWVIGWLMLGGNVFYPKVVLRRVGVSMLVVSCIFQWSMINIFSHMAPLHWMWWS